MGDEQREEMRVSIGTQVIGADGERIGDVDGVVLNPANDKVRLIVMRKGKIFHSDQTFGVRSVTSINEQGVHVSFTRDESEMMDHYMDADYLTPPDGYFGGSSGVFWPSKREIYTGEMNSEEPDMETTDPRLGSQERLLELVHGAEVHDSDGEKLGKVADLATDPAGRITALRVDQGRIRHHERWVPIHFVAQADEEHVRLGVTLAELDDRLEQQGSIDPGHGFVLDLDG